MIRNDSSAAEPSDSTSAAESRWGSATEDGTVSVWTATPGTVPADDGLAIPLHAAGEDVSSAGDDRRDDLDPVSKGPIEVEPPRASAGARLGSMLREALETIVLALLIFITVRTVVQNFKVEGSSMEPNLHSGQYLLVNKAAYFVIDFAALGQRFPAVFPQSNELSIEPFGDPERGDIIVFRYPRDPSRDFIKRVMAIPGDTVLIRGGRVIVNGVQMEEPYITDSTSYSKDSVTVPPEHYYVLGDNRNNSSDSHVWGPVPRENIIGKAWLSYWPLGDWGLAPNYPVSAGD